MLLSSDPATPGSSRQHGTYGKQIYATFAKACDELRPVNRIELGFDLQNPDKFKSRMHSLAYGQAMAAAARDYQKVCCLQWRAVSSYMPL